MRFSKALSVIALVQLWGEFGVLGFCISKQCKNRGLMTAAAFHFRKTNLASESRLHASLGGTDECPEISLQPQLSPVHDTCVLAMG